MGTPGTPNSRRLLTSMEVQRELGIDRTCLHYWAARYKITNYGNPGRALWCPNEIRLYTGERGDPPPGYVSTKEAARLLNMTRSSALRRLSVRFQPTTFRVNRGQSAQMWLRSDVMKLREALTMGTSSLPSTIPSRPMYDDGEDDWIPEGAR